MDDDADLAAKRVLARLVDTHALDLASSRGVPALVGGAARFLLTRGDAVDRAAQFAEWLIDQAEVTDLFADDALIETVLAEEWEGVRTSMGTPVIARNAELEASLLADPDDVERRLVYGDWLQKMGDIHGELIARQVAASAQSADDATRREAGTFLESHAREILGELAGDLRKVVHLEWQSGFVRAARVAREPADIETYELAVVLARLLEHRACLLLRKLELAEHDGQTNRLADAVRVLVRVRPSLLQDLLLEGEDAGDIGSLLSVFPHLRKLDVRTTRASFDQLEHPRIEHLRFDPVLDRGAVLRLARSHLPSLAQMELTSWSGLRSVDDAARLFAVGVFPGLRHLSLKLSIDVLASLAASSLVPRLVTLDLSESGLDDRAVAVFSSHREAFSRLTRLDLHANRLTESACARLADLCPEVLLSEQEPSEEDYAYDYGEEGEEGEFDDIME